MTEQTPEQADGPDITVVVVNYNTAHLLDRLFSALAAAQGDLRIQTIVVDNASRDNSVDILRTKYPAVELIENLTNVGFGRANNQAISRIEGQHVLLLNTDAFVSPDTFTKTLNFMTSAPRCGILGVKLVGEDGTLQPSCRFFPTPWNVFLVSTGLDRFFRNSRLIDDMKWDHSGIRQCDWIPGCYYLIRRQVIDQIGLFDPRFFLYYEEVDHCRRAIHAGWKVYFFPNTEVVHIGGESAKSEAPLTDAGRQIARLQIESELLYFRKHHGLAGLMTSIILTACGALLATIKDVLRPVRGRPRTAAREKIGIVLSLLRPTHWATQPTR
ncbi:MAG TPA: glycosyltransferase family 2 protein [Pseudolabrys sp.]|nr:glycosyltransferase family 2 protein [Pseudolabrys sp.]